MVFVDFHGLGAVWPYNFEALPFQSSLEGTLLPFFYGLRRFSWIGRSLAEGEPDGDLEQESRKQCPALCLGNHNSTPRERVACSAGSGSCSLSSLPSCRSDR